MFFINMVVSVVIILEVMLEYFGCSFGDVCELIVKCM